MNKERGERRIRRGGNTREEHFGFGSIIFHIGGLYCWFGLRSLLEDCITSFA
jgi:hypothetical protein